MQSSGRRSESEDVAYYTAEMYDILTAKPTYGVPPEPSEIYPGVFLGSASHAENIAQLRRLRITYILNCAGIPAIRSQRDMRYDKDSGIVEYSEVPAQDGESYDMIHHFVKAHGFIDHALSLRGRILVYCPDVNRSGCIAIGYLIKQGTALLRATQMIKMKRNVVLFNKGFMKQLVLYARDRGQLERDMTPRGRATPCVSCVGLYTTRHRHRPIKSYNLYV